MTKKVNMTSNKDGFKNKDNLKNEGDLKTKGDINNEDESLKHVRLKKVFCISDGKNSMAPHLVNYSTTDHKLEILSAV